MEIKTLSILREPRLIYIGFFLSIVIGATLTVDIPGGFTPYVKAAWEKINSLPDGFNYYNYRLGGGSSTLYASKAVVPAFFNQILRKNARVIVAVPDVDADMVARVLLSMIYKVDSVQNSPLYGKNIVYIGVIPTTTEAILSMLDDWTKIVKLDAFGNSLSDYTKLPMMEKFKGIKACDLMTLVGDDVPIYYPLLRTETVKVIMTADANRIAREDNQYYNAGLVQGMLIGVRQAGQYEKLENVKGLAYTFYLAETLTSVYTVGGLLIGCVWYLYAKSTAGRKEK